MGSSSQQFCVRWNSYQSNLQNAFPKLLNSENFVDVTLACEAQTIKCHKVVLSACSSYFETMLSQNPCQHPIIFMKDMKFWEIKALVDFMYRGEVNVTQEELTSLLKAAEALQVRGLYGYEQQRAAAAATCSEATNGSEEPSQSNCQLPNTPSLPANTTLQSLQDTKTRSHASSTQEDSNDQMVKLEEEIMMMEEQSISDSSHLDNDFSTLGSSQEFDGFAGDQRYSQPSSVIDPEGGGPSGLTLTPNATSTPSSHQQDSMLSQQQLLQHQDDDNNKSAAEVTGRKPHIPRGPNWNRIGHFLDTGPGSSGKSRAPSIWESTLSKDDMVKQLNLAVDLIMEGNSYRYVSTMLKIPKSTIFSYVSKKKKGRELFQKKQPVKRPLPPGVRVEIENGPHRKVPTIK